MVKLKSTMKKNDKKIKEKIETRSAKLTRLAKKAEELDQDIQYSEYQMYDIMDKIREMKPTKREINYRDLQSLLDCY